MDETRKLTGIVREIPAAGRIALATMAICCLFYGLVILAFGRTVVPDRAEGSMIRDPQGNTIGSELIAQGFSRPEYFWPRPSEVDYNAAAAGGSNYSPANPVLRARAEKMLVMLHASTAAPVPADLVTESGSGLDPHITLAAARYQAERVASARGVPKTAVMAVLEKNAYRTGGVFAPEPLVNVLQVNMALDKMGQ
jgi:K+-transporting ATPase ATPase C chain